MGDLGAVISSAVLQALPELSRRFQRALPYPHVVIDDFLAPQACRELAASFPGEKDWRGPSGPGSYFDARRARVYAHVRELGAPWAALDEALGSASFIRWVEGLSGISGLEHDPSYAGSGPREYFKGMRLWPHLDYNVHPETGRFLRVRMLIYLNERWSRGHGGELCVHVDPRKRPVARVAPIYNRCVLIAFDERTWHSVAPVVHHGGRRCMSLAYYCRAPAPGDSVPRGTRFWRPLLSQEVRPGCVLDEGLLGGIRAALARRAQESAGVRAQALLASMRRRAEAWTPGYRLSDQDSRRLWAAVGRALRPIEDWTWRGRAGSSAYLAAASELFAQSALKDSR